MATFFPVGATYGEQLAQGKPVYDLVSSGQYRDIPKAVLDNYFTGKASTEDTVAAITGSPVFNPNTGPVVNGTSTGPGGVTANPGLGTGFSVGKTSYGQQPTQMPGQSTADYQNKIRDYLANRSTQSVDTGVETRTDPATGTTDGSTGTGTGTGTSSSTTSNGTAPTTYDELLKSLGPAPAAPNFEDRQAQLEKDAGLDGLNTQLGTVNDQINALNAKVTGQAADVNATPTSSAFRNNALGTLSKDEKVQLANLQGQQKTLTTQIANANKAIQTTMSLEKSDYQTAVSSYNNAFSQNMRVLTANNSTGNTQETHALANFKYLMDTYAKHNISYSDLSDSEKSDLQTVAQQTGSGPELLAFMEAKPKSTITNRTTDPTTGTTTITSQDQSGNTKVTKITNNTSAQKPYTSGSLSIPRADISDGQQRLEASRGTDGYADTKTYNDMMNHWIHAGGLQQDFLKQYPPKNYLNPNDKTVPSYLLK